MDRLHLDPSSQPQQPRHDRAKPGDRPQRREPLKFPQGGVFGLSMAPVLEQVEDALSIARAIERRLDTMQEQLNELEAELDDPYVFPLARLGQSPHDTRPLAA